MSVGRVGDGCWGMQDEARCTARSWCAQWKNGGERDHHLHQNETRTPWHATPHIIWLSAQTFRRLFATAQPLPNVLSAGKCSPTQPLQEILPVLRAPSSQWPNVERHEREPKEPKPANSAAPRLGDPPLALSGPAASGGRVASLFDPGYGSCMVPPPPPRSQSLVARPQGLLPVPVCCRLSWAAACSKNVSSAPPPVCPDQERSDCKHAKSEAGAPPNCVWLRIRSRSVSR